MEPALIQVYTGEGKGKTTAAIGLAVRALGQGLRVLLARFLKPATPESGEVVLLKSLPGIDILTAGVGIVGPPADPQAVVASVAATFRTVRERAAGYDLIILDEINNALHRGYLPLTTMLAFLDERPKGVELVLTGRNAPPEILARADLATRMEKIRHPFDRGIAARRGVEF